MTTLISSSKGMLSSVLLSTVVLLVITSGIASSLHMMSREWDNKLRGPFDMMVREPAYMVGGPGEAKRGTLITKVYPIIEQPIVTAAKENGQSVRVLNILKRLRTEYENRVGSSDQSGRLAARLRDFATLEDNPGPMGFPFTEPKTKRIL